MMPSKKKKYNARFPAGRIKKIMQTDEDVGKVAQAVPVIISRALELFVESLLTKAVKITNSKNAKTLTPSHMKQCILSESKFDFLKELVSNISDVTASEDEPTTPIGSGFPVSFPPAHRKGDGGCSRGRSRGGGVRQSGSSRSSTSLQLAKTPSQPSTPVTPTTPFTPTYPSFYEEIPIASEEREAFIKKEAMIRPPVIQHTANHRPVADDSGDEEEDDDDSPAENGLLMADDIENFSTHQPTKPLLIDDDYDT